MLEPLQYRDEADFQAALAKTREHIVDDKAAQKRYFYQPAHIDWRAHYVEPAVVAFDQAGNKCSHIHVRYMPEAEACRSPESKRMAQFLKAKGFKIGEEGIADQLFDMKKALEAKKCGN